jgi:hypothetical protein
MLSASSARWKNIFRVPSDLFVNLHLGTEMHSVIVANLANRTTIAKICALNLHISPANLLRPE